MTIRISTFEVSRGHLFRATLAVVAAAWFLTPVAPVAFADPLPNGYDVSCVKSDAGHVVCTTSGCPRVHEDLAGDVIHTKVNGGPQQELSKACGNTTTETIATSSSFDYGIQGCRKHDLSSDDCGAWANYHYEAPATPGPVEQPQAEQKPAEPAPVAQPVQCTDGSTVTPPATCPVAPTNAVTLSLSKAGFQAHAKIGNTSNLPATCTYDASEANGLGQPIHRDGITVPAKGSTTLDFPAPLPLQSWNATASCTAPFGSTTVEIGRATGSL